MIHTVGINEAAYVAFDASGLYTVNNFKVMDRYNNVLAAN